VISKVTIPTVLQLLTNVIAGIVLVVWIPEGKPVIGAVVVATHSKVVPIISDVSGIACVCVLEQIVWFKLD
jgi:hypothetical protein